MTDLTRGVDSDHIQEKKTHHNTGNIWGEQGTPQIQEYVCTLTAQETEGLDQTGKVIRNAGFRQNERSLKKLELWWANLCKLDLDKKKSKTSKGRYPTKFYIPYHI